MPQNSSSYTGTKRADSIVMSMIRTVMERTREMKEAGLPVIPFVAGEPNFDTPTDIKEAVIEAIRENWSHYASNCGVLALRQGIAARLLRETGVSYDPVKEILVTSSGAEAINNALTALLDPGDEVIIPSPAFVNYANVARIIGAKPVEVPLHRENGMQIDIDDLRAAVTPKTRVIALNNPCNPTGVLYSHETLKAVCELACERNLIVFSDEIYNNLVYDGQKFESAASFPGMKERTVVMNGFSKTFAMTGWRLGYLCAPAAILADILKVHQYSTTSSPTFIQVGVAKAMNTEGTEREIQAMLRAFAERRELVTQGFDRAGISYIPPRGAFYCFADVSSTGLSGEEFCRRLLEEKYVAAVPGIGFGKECGDFVRFSYATDSESIKEGMKRIGEFTRSL